VVENTIGMNVLKKCRVAPPKAKRTNQAAISTVLLDVNHDKGHNSCICKKQKREEKLNKSQKHMTSK
jgi:hypothetical protein